MLTINQCLILFPPDLLKHKQCNTLGSLQFACCIPYQRMYQNLISYGKTLVNDALSASITPRKTVFPSVWDALKGGQRALWIYALSKIKRWTLIILSFPGIWGSLKAGTTDHSFTKQLNWDILPGQCEDLDSMPTFVYQGTFNLGFLLLSFYMYYKFGYTGIPQGKYSTSFIWEQLQFSPRLRFHSVYHWKQAYATIQDPLQDILLSLQVVLPCEYESGWLWLPEGWLQSSWVIFSLITSHLSRGSQLAGGKAGCKEKGNCLGKKEEQCSRKRGKSVSVREDMRCSGRKALAVGVFSFCLEAAKLQCLPRKWKRIFSFTRN